MFSLRDQLAARLDANLSVDNSCVLFAAAGKLYIKAARTIVFPSDLQIRMDAQSSARELSP